MKKTMSCRKRPCGWYGEFVGRPHCVAAADNGLQIHGGNGFAEYSISRTLCDAYPQHLCSGAAEIQAQVIHVDLMD